MANTEEERSEIYVVHGEYVRLTPPKGMQRDVYVQEGSWWASKVNTAHPDETPRAYHIREFIAAVPQNKVLLSRSSGEALKVASLTGSWDPVTLVADATVHTVRIEPKSKPKSNQQAVVAAAIEAAVAPLRVELAAASTSRAALRADVAALTALLQEREGA